MQRRTFLRRSQLIGLSLIVLLGLVLLLMLQRPVATPVVRGVELSDSEVVAPVSAVDAADRKFFMQRGSGISLETSLHPADIKFMSGASIGSSSPTEALPALESVHPADRKFLSGASMGSASLTEALPALESVDPADRKFFFNWAR